MILSFSNYNKIHKYTDTDRNIKQEKHTHTYTPHIQRESRGRGGEDTGKIYTFEMFW